jgi:FtsH-binding integral membrane protein
MATSVTLTQRQRNRKFNLALSLVAIAIVFVGFSRTYYLNGYFEHRNLTWFLHLHGFLFSSWFLVVLLQIALVAMGRIDLHRRVGVAGATLAAVMVVVGVASGIHAAKYGSLSTPPNVPRLVFLVVPIVDMVVFATLTAAGVLYRRRPEYHKRLMMLATLGILTAAIARIPLSFIQSHGLPAIFGMADVLVLVFIGYDTISHKRLHPANLWGGLLILLSLPVRFFLGGTAVWLAFAQWLTR